MKKSFVLYTAAVFCVIMSAISCKKETAPQETIKNYRFTYSGTSVKAAELPGTSPSGMIYWGDGDSQDWTEDAVHNYVDGITEHIVEIQTSASGFELTSMSGVSRIEIQVI